jgi:hypothetical protein
MPTMAMAIRRDMAIPEKKESPLAQGLRTNEEAAYFGVSFTERESPRMLRKYCVFGFSGKE